MTIYCAIKLEDREKSFLKNAIGSIPIVFREDLPQEKRIDYFYNAEICFGNVRPEWLNNTTKLQWIQLQSVGFGEYQNLQPRTEFKMTNLKNFFAVPVAETALAGILALYRGMDRFTEQKEKRIWVGLTMRPHLHVLQEKKVVILGGGSIGQHLKKLLTAFDAEITIFGTRPVNSDIQTLDQLDMALSATDIVVSSLPGTEQTIGLFDAKRLARLKPTALFINVGRGSAVEEDALIPLLMERKIGGAVLDVTRQEPLPKDHPFYNCPNTLITQHTAGGYADEILDIVKVFLRNLERFREGKELEGIVDIVKGY